MQTIWRVARPDENVVATLAATLNLPPLIARLLVNRGVVSSGDAQAFLSPSLDQLHDPHCLPDVDKAVERLARALETSERIFIHGDYDADGVTSAALCLRALSALGANVVGHVPRRSDGYDLQKAGVDKAKADGATLILTADCGVGAIEAVAYANTLGIDVIVTDHHRPGPHLPDAVAIVNPYRESCDAPFKELCGAGVAFKVLDALVARVAPAHRDSFRRSLLDLVALGTVADVTPLRGENRVLVAHGLLTLARGKKPGLRALILSAGLENKTLTADTIAWKIGPRLNAAGRMEDADLAYRLLTTGDEIEASQLAQQLDALCERSRDESRRVTSEAMALALLPEHEGRRVLVLAQNSWGKGVMGLAASRIVEQCRRPVILLAYDKDADQWHGSGRSYGAFNLHAAFHDCAALLGRFGGHSASAGVSLPAANLEAFRDRLHALAEGIIGDEPVAPEIVIDGLATGSEWSLAAMDWLERLAPFGRENPEPVFATHGAIALGPRRMGPSGAHFRMDVRLPGAHAPIKAISFNSGDLADTLSSGDEVDIAYTPKINDWRGQQSVEFHLVDVRAAGARQAAD